MRIVIAPDSFKSTMSAAEVARHLADGVRAGGAVPVLRPLADGGEGTTAALAAAVGGRQRHVLVAGPLGNPTTATFLLSDDGSTAVVEMAAATGLHLMRPTDDNAVAASSGGTGDLISAAVAAGARRILLGIGGSASSDGGAGALHAIHAAGGLRGARVTVLCDVDTPYELAAAVYGPQKGASPATVERLTQRLDDLARRLPRDPRTVARTGAGGGLSGALWAVHDADLVSGIDAILTMIEFDDLLVDAAAVITGEGRLDAQTLQGKAIHGVCTRAARANVPVWAAVGQSELTPAEVHRLGLAGALIAGDPAGLRAAGRRIAEVVGASATPTPPPQL